MLSTNVADVPAFGAVGNLTIIRVKRNHSNRGTVGQLLEYATKMKGYTCDQLNNYAIKSGKLAGKILHRILKSLAMNKHNGADRILEANGK